MNDLGVLRDVTGLDACAVSDALDTLALPPSVLTGIRPIWPVRGVVIGRARTVQAGERTGTGPSAHIAAATVEDGAPGDIIVVANGGRTDVSCWGGILTEAALKKGVDAVIVDGACRDVAESHEAAFPVFARASVPTSARGRIVQLSSGEPIEVGGVEIRDGDIVVADSTGVVVVPQTWAGQVAVWAERIVTREARMRDQVRSGASIVEVMHDTAFPTPEHRPTPGDLDEEQ